MSEVVEKTAGGDRYIGPFKVIGITKLDVKTPRGSEVVKVLYENRPAEIMPLASFELVVTPEPTDLTNLQRRRFDVLIPKIVEELAEMDVRMFELPGLLNKVHETVTDHFERASSYLWTGDDRNWTHGMNFMNNRTIIETHKVLLEMEGNNDGISENTIEYDDEKPA